jgi:hypothetical protein
LEKVADLVFRAQLLDPKYSSTLCDEIKHVSSDHPTLDIERIDVHKLGLEQMATKIVKAYSESIW